MRLQIVNNVITLWTTKCDLWNIIWNFFFDYRCLWNKILYPFCEQYPHQMKFRVAVHTFFCKCLTSKQWLFSAIIFEVNPCICTRSECFLVCNHNWILLLTLQLDQLIKCSLLKFTFISIRLSLAIVFVDFTIHFIFYPTSTPSCVVLFFWSSVCWHS